ncbi:hypothetical protein DPMN_111684 [Dreissena polymorpha]|uniref:Uncharacterized protein n=1 Tax=Dreissena polymorpha TaxID=45954 RepID=A0A9D4QP27_DREPO|nr:hypothetical protein DPMN_111684 [Dreissena polymorpha]
MMKKYIGSSQFRQYGLMQQSLSCAVRLKREAFRVIHFRLHLNPKQHPCYVDICQYAKTIEVSAAFLRLKKVKCTWCLTQEGVRLI